MKAVACDFEHAGAGWAELFGRLVGVGDDGNALGGLWECTRQRLGMELSE